MASHSWSLMESGQWEEAYAAFTEEYNSNANPVSLTNRGLALLNMGRILEARHDFVRLVELRGNSDFDFLFLGATNWFLGYREAAVENWKQALEAPYTDAAGGVVGPAVLMYAATKMDDLELAKFSLKLLRQRWRTKAARAWPGPVAGLYLGKLSIEEVLAAAESPVKALAARQRCQADFHIGVNALRQSLGETAMVHFSSAATNTEALSKVEYYLARSEVGLL